MHANKDEINAQIKFTCSLIYFLVLWWQICLPWEVSRQALIPCSGKMIICKVLDVRCIQKPCHQLLLEWLSHKPQSKFWECFYLSKGSKWNLPLAVNILFVNSTKTNSNCYFFKHKLIWKSVHIIYSQKFWSSKGLFS